MPARERERVGLVGAHDARAGGLGEELVERLDDGGEVAVAVEVVGFDVGDHHQLGGELDEGAVALVGLDDEPRAPRPTPTPLPRPWRSPPTRKLGCSPPAPAASASIEVVVVLPCVPETAAVRRVAQIAASTSARLDTRMPRRRASASSGLRSVMAVDTATSSASPRLAASWPTCTTTPSARSRSSAGDGRRSEPDTRWPIATRIVAIADMAAPPTPTTCTRHRSCEVERGGRRLRHGRGPRARSAIAPAASGRARCWSASPMPLPALGVVEQRVELVGEPFGRELGVGDDHGGIGVGQPPGVAGLVVAGDVGRRHEHRREAGGRHLEAHRRSGAEDADVRRGQRGGHGGLVLDLLVHEAALGQFGGGGADVVPVAAADDVADRHHRAVGPAFGQPDGGVVDRAGPERATGDEHDPPILGELEGPAGGDHAGRRTVDGRHLGADRVAGDGRSRAAGSPERPRPRPGRTARRTGWPRRDGCSARRRRSGSATARPRRRTGTTRSRRGQARPWVAGAAAARWRYRRRAGCPTTAATLAKVKRRWMPRPGRRVCSTPAAGTRSASTPRAAPT